MFKSQLPAFTFGAAAPASASADPPAFTFGAAASTGASATPQFRFGAVAQRKQQQQPLVSPAAVPLPGSAMSLDATARREPPPPSAVPMPTVLGAMSVDTAAATPGLFQRGARGAVLPGKRLFQTPGSTTPAAQRGTCPVYPHGAAVE